MVILGRNSNPSSGFTVVHAEGRGEGAAAAAAGTRGEGGAPGLSSCSSFFALVVVSLESCSWS